jgi:hypothetical protein
MPLNTQNAVDTAADQQAKIDQFNGPRPTPSTNNTNLLNISRAVGAAGSGLDWLSTYNILSRGGHEMNPMLQWTHDDPAKTALAGAGVDALTGLLLERVLKNHPKVLSGIYLGRGALGTGAAIHNFNTPGSK